MFARGVVNAGTARPHFWSLQDPSREARIHRGVPSTKKRVNHLHQVPEEDSITSQSYVVDFDPSRI
jgi:hypothetical protein